MPPTAPRLALLYALFALLAVLLLAILIPPFRNADEDAQYRRADQISHGGMIAHRIGNTGAGGRVDGGINAGLDRFLSPQPGQHPLVRVSRPLYAALPWGALTPTDFPNTAIYPPFLYAPAAIATAIGRATGLTVLRTMILARLADGLVSVCVASLAIALSGTAAPFLFAVLLLPMSLAQMAALTQDGPMLAGAALAAALCLRLQRPGTPHQRSAFAALVLCLTLIGMARPPYAALAVLPLATTLPRRARWAGAICILFCTFGWAALMAAHTIPSDVLSRHAPTLQLGRMLRHPTLLPRALIATLRQQTGSLVIEFVGKLGWLDIDLPHALHRALRAALLLAALTTVLLGGERRAWRTVLLIVTGIAACCLGVFTIQYLTWGANGGLMPNEIGQTTIYGVQGRYFLPPALAFAAALAAPGIARRPGLGWIALPVYGLPIVTIATVVLAIVWRFYV